MKRKYSIVQETYECAVLPYEMPYMLFQSQQLEEQQRKQAEKDESAVQSVNVYEQGGILKWNGRYSLISSTASRNASSKSKKGKKTTGPQTRAKSEHKFQVT